MTFIKLLIAINNDIDDIKCLLKTYEIDNSNYDILLIAAYRNNKMSKSASSEKILKMLIDIFDDINITIDKQENIEYGYRNRTLLFLNEN